MPRGSTGTNNPKAGSQYQGSGASSDRNLRSNVSRAKPTEDGFHDYDTEFEKNSCGTCKVKKVKCDKKKGKCTRCTVRGFTCEYSEPKWRRNRSQQKTACDTCHDRKVGCKVTEMSNPVCTACSKSPTSCSFHPAYEAEEAHSEDNDGIAEPEEEVQSRRASPTGSGGSGTPVVEERDDQTWTEATVSCIGRYGDAFDHNMEADSVQHPFRYKVQ